MKPLLTDSATSMAQAIQTGKISAVELLQETFARVDAVNPVINAVIWQDRDSALQEAAACDAEHASGSRRGPLHGVPVTVKESFDLKGSPSTWGMPELAHTNAKTDSDAVARYRAAGGIVYGKTNVPLKLADWQSFNAVYGTTSNPWDTTRTPGGSSGGSAAALATGMAALEVGSDIGSSIRNPAHYCGVFGLKPTWNVVSTAGQRLEGNYLDVDIAVGGPMARSAGDLAVGFDVLAGPSHYTATKFQLALPADHRERLGEFRIALMLGDDVAPVDAPYLDALSAFADQIEATGAIVTRNRLPAIDHDRHFTVYLKLLGAALAMAISDDEARAMIAQFDDAPDDVKRVAQTRMQGIAMSHREWLSLDNERRKARRAFDAFFEDFDVILSPVCASAAFPKNEEGHRLTRRIIVNNAPYLECRELFWSGYSGVCGLPAAVGPMAQIGGLPVGYQAVCGHGRDYTALAFARAVEREIIGYTPPPMIR